MRCIGRWRGLRARLKKKPSLCRALCSGRPAREGHPRHCVYRPCLPVDSQRGRAIWDAHGDGQRGSILCAVRWEWRSWSDSSDQGYGPGYSKGSGVYSRNSVGAQHQRFHDGFRLCDEGAGSRFHRVGDEQRGAFGGWVGRPGPSVQYQPLSLCNTSRYREAHHLRRSDELSVARARRAFGEGQGVDTGRSTCRA